ncbi:uncharacterized protein LOC123260210 [Cotesia glomerata]|uniref:uncharacterized protein LOC123260210 n=1 Tax=Cotesia glomerata TaxID=32391 RepID=UPI001D0351A6|nr:uncharacterized protein LOC123260210 [Cotesia glomerata]
MQHDAVLGDEEFIFEEIEKRLTRRNSVILFNCPESVHADIESRSIADSALVNKFCSALDIDVPSSQFRVELLKGQEGQATSSGSQSGQRDNNARSNLETTTTAQTHSGRTSASYCGWGEQSSTSDEAWQDDHLQQASSSSGTGIERSSILNTSCDQREAFRGSGGGVLIACNTSVQVQCNNLDQIIEQFPQIDVVSVTVGLNPAIDIIALYVPPDLHIQAYSDFLDALSTHRTVDARELVVIGDFNSPHFYSYVNNGYVCAKAEIIHSFSCFLNLIQYNNVLNSMGRLLDLVFGTIECATMINNEPLLKLDPYHPVLSISLQTIINRGKNITKVPVSRYNFHKYDKGSLMDALGSVSWDLMNNLLPEDICRAFYQLIESAFDRSLPKTGACSKQDNSNYPPWFTWDIICDCKLKETFRQKLLKHPSSYYKSQYDALRGSLKLRIKYAHRKYQTEAENSLANNPKNFWRFIKNSKRQSQYPTSFCINNVTNSDPQSIANEFALHFSSVFIPFDNSADLSNINTISDYLGGIIFPNKATILKYIKRLPNKMSAGIDGIPCLIVKDAAACFVKPLTQLIKCSIKHGIFPSSWKNAKVCPIHKADDPTSVTNYRPISIISVFAKVFEMYVYDQLLRYVSVAISNAQHGFFCRRSTVDVIQTDFAKAFDKVDTVILIHRLRDLGLPSYLLTLMMSYLTNRLNYVIFNGFRSVPFSSTSGVPQGSNLGPLLFLIFINPLESVISCPFELFADDAKYYTRIRSWTDCLELQSNVDVIAAWWRLNKLQLNERKCVVISFSKSSADIQYPYSINGIALNYVSSCRDLGVIFDNNFAFTNHYSTIAASALRTLGFVIRATKNFRNLEAVKMLYSALVRPKLEYASIIWSPTYKKYAHSIEKIQRKFLKYLMYKMTGNYPARGAEYLDICRSANIINNIDNNSSIDNNDTGIDLFDFNQLLTTSSIASILIDMRNNNC